MSYKTFILTTALATLVAGSAIAQDRPAGWESMPCDSSQFTPVTDSAGNIAYWLNPTCPSSAGGGAIGVAGVPPIVTPDPEPELPDEFDPEVEFF
jgi:hypothetical protein